MKYLLVPLFLFGFAVIANAQSTEQILKKNKLDRFVARPMDDLLDTLSVNYRLRFVFERDSLHRYDVVERFFNEPLNKVLAKICKQFDLHYWIDASGAIYVLQDVDDLARLKQIAATIKPLPPVKIVTAQADTTDEQDVEALYDKDGKRKPEISRKRAQLQALAVQKTVEPLSLPPENKVHLLVTVIGKVINQSSGEPLPSATVRVYNTPLSVSTNSDGAFTIFRVPSDTCTLDISFSGFQPYSFKLDPGKLASPLVLGLYPSLSTLNEVTILGQKSGVMNTDVKKVGVLQLSPANLDKLPSLGEKDVMRAFQLMPGVGATNESSSGAYVRGGTPDQNLVIFDGFTVYQVDHLYGFFSAFNSNAIKDLQLYKGGFSAQYGGRLSSVTQINGKEGNKNNTVFGVDLSLLSVNAFMETPVTSNSSLVLAIRRSYQGPFYDKIFKQFNTSSGFSGGPGGPGGGPGGFGEQTTPASHFYDANVRYTNHLDQNDILTWSFYSGSDKTDNSRQLQLPSFLGSGIAPDITDYTAYGNLASSFKWFRQWNNSVYSNTYLTYSSYFNDRERGTTGSYTDDEGQEQSFSTSTVEKNNLHDIGVRSDWVWTMQNQLKLKYGVFASRQHISYDYVQNDTSHRINQHNTAVLGGLFTELEYDPTNALHLQPGIRMTQYGPTARFYAEPRFSASYVLNDNYTLKFATGQFYQFMNEVTRDDIAEGNRQFWVLSNNSSIPVGRSRHLMGGISYENDQFLLDVEGYYKWLNGLTQYTITQTGFGPGRGTPAIQEDFYSGTGRAKGIEVLLQKKMGNYTGWLSYTLADAENKFTVYGANFYPADQDIRHEFKAINMYHYSRWNFAAVFIFSTGHPYTAPLSTYSITNADGTRQTYFNVSGKNAERLPDYHRLDLSATYDLLKINGDKIGSIGLSLFNVYNHVNTWYREYYLQNNAAVTTSVNYLGFTPNITLSLRWK